MSRSGGSGTPRRGFERWRWIVATGLLGMAIGFGWGIADEPTYRATSSVVLAPVEGGEPDPAAAERFAEIGGSREVANAAAGLLGDDVPGADLLADVTVSAASDGVSVRVAANADQPDFAVAAADGYAQALVDVAAESAGGGDPPLVVGTAASLPDDPIENRPAFVWSLLGLGAGLLVGSLVALALPRRRARGAAPADGTAGPSPSPVADGLGAPVLASLGDPGAALRTTEPGVMALEDPAAEPFREAVEGLDLGRPGVPRTLAVVPTETGGDPAVVAIGLAAAAAERGLRVLLVEAGAEAAVAAIAGVPEAPGLVDYLDGRAAPRDVLRSLLVRADGSEPFPLACVPAGDRAGGDPDDLAAARMQALAERLPRVYDLVLLLGSPSSGGGGSAALAALADGVVLVSAGGGRGEGGSRSPGERLGGTPVVGEILVGA